MSDSATAEEDNDEVTFTKLQSQQSFVTLVKRILRFAIDNMHKLIFDDEGAIVWPEAAENLAQLVQGNETEEQLQIYIIKAIEPIISKKTYTELDEGIKKLNIGIRGLIAAAISGARVYLSQRPVLISELVNDWDGIMDALLTADYQYLHDVIMESPNLRKWMQGYVLHKLNIKEDEYFNYARPKSTSQHR